MEPFPLQLPDPLLPPGHTGKNPESPGLFRPRTILHHPVMAIRHVIDSRKEKKRLETR